MFHGTSNRRRDGLSRCSRGGESVSGFKDLLLPTAAAAVFAAGFRPAAAASGQFVAPGKSEFSIMRSMSVFVSYIYGNVKEILPQNGGGAPKGRRGCASTKVLSCSDSAEHRVCCDAPLRLASLATSPFRGGIFKPHAIAGFPTVP